LPDGDVEAILESPNDTQTSSSASAVSGGWWEVLGGCGADQESKANGID